MWRSTSLRCCATVLHWQDWTGISCGTCTGTICLWSCVCYARQKKTFFCGRPLEEDCTIELLHFHSENPFHCNRAFWRSCSLLLGAAVEAAMSEEVTVHQHSFPPPNVSSGSFVADIDLGFGHTWEPTRYTLDCVPLLTPLSSGRS